MSNKDIIDRNQILGTSKVEFDKALRGYACEQVDEFISQLLASQKNTSEAFDVQMKELRNDNSMLNYELNEAKEEISSLKDRNEYLLKENERLVKQVNEAPKEIKVVDNTELIEAQEKYNTLFTKHRLMSEDNRKLVRENEDLKRDIAHLTKKVNKNRTEINTLRNDSENAYENVTDERFIALSNLYEDALDKCEDLIFKLQTELSLAHSKAEDIQNSK